MPQSQEKEREMDVPKITVFKSPPWQKPNILPTPKISDVYEEFPSRNKLLQRRSSLTRSLECIPENNILQDIHKHSSNYTKESNRLSPHQVLPPINKACGEDFCPEMRQRAYSDPHRYTTAAALKKSDDRRESPLAKNSQPSPPKTKQSDSYNSHPLTPDNKTARHRPGAVPKKTSSPNSIQSPKGSIRKALRMSPQSDAAASALRDNSNRPRSQNESPNSSPVPRSPSSTPDHRTRKMTKLVSKPPLANGAQPIHPAVAQLRRLVDGRSRRNSLPSNFANSSLRRVRSPASSTIIGHTREGVKESTAYALIGSPGRSRWPSPDRNSSSYINTSGYDGNDASDSSVNSSSESIHHAETPSLTATPTAGPQSASNNDLYCNASEEFKSILKDFKHNERKDICSIKDPEQYFKVASAIHRANARNPTKH